MGNFAVMGCKSVPKRAELRNLNRVGLQGGNENVDLLIVPEWG
jgi:hypothetical protein